ncbi:XRE family transcriptional regulator [Burkholderia cenocepacia]|uniref:XRE family transcriptional regulator n=1 Tax=Burkholderia cenocepacia TaxID=95486 RepID=A0A6J5JPW5_9BURK|nr:MULTISPECIES: helix-turn-helix transcriptional regulator [Burkholderia cepacia complex]CAB3973882.1 XRE family transcriptional regulator [Burkholderia cenocepacia]
MTIDETKVTTFATICVVLLREVRLERGFHQAQIADAIGKTASAWTKVEAGKSPLSFETFIRVCNSLQVSPSAVMAAAERYASMLTNKWSGPGWAVLSTEHDGDDTLMRAAQEYWASPGFRNHQANRWGFQTILNSPYPNADGTFTIAPVFEFAVNDAFREEQLNPVLTAPPSMRKGF